MKAFQVGHGDLAARQRDSPYLQAFAATRRSTNLAPTFGHVAGQWRPARREGRLAAGKSNNLPF
jgi:hypothetical protein